MLICQYNERDYLTSWLKITQDELKCYKINQSINQSIVVAPEGLWCNIPKWFINFILMVIKPLVNITMFLSDKSSKYCDAYFGNLVYTSIFQGSWLGRGLFSSVHKTV